MMIVSNVRNKCFAMNYSESFFKFWCFPWYELHPSSSHWSDTTGTYTHTSFPRQFWLWKKITKCLNRLLCIAFDDKTWNISFLYLSNTARKPTVVLGWQWRSFHPVGLQNKFDSVSQALVRQLLLCRLKFHLFFKLWCTKKFLRFRWSVTSELPLTSQSLLIEFNFRKLCKFFWLQPLLASLNKTLSIFSFDTKDSVKYFFLLSKFFFFWKNLWPSIKQRLLNH